MQNQRNVCFGISRFGCVVRHLQCWTSFCPPRHHNLVDLVDVDLLFTSPEGLQSSQINLSKETRARQDRSNGTGIVEMPSPFPFEILVFCVCVILLCPAQHFSWLQENTSRCASARVRCLRCCFGCFCLRINSACIWCDLRQTLWRLSTSEIHLFRGGISDNVHFYHITLTEIEFPLMHFCVS